MLLIVATTFVLCLVSIGVHYESLRQISNLAVKVRFAYRLRVAMAVLLALGAHFVEVLIFAVSWATLIEFDLAALSVPDPRFSEIVYFSLSAYTSLGFGDIVPIGPCGVLAGVQALVGLVLIAWTASFTLYEMRRYWFEAE